MAKSWTRSALFTRIILVHMCGLVVTGLYGSIGTTAGFGSGAGAAFFLGGILSIPWLAVTAIVVSRRKIWFARQILLLAVLGPMLVCASYLLVFGGFIEAVAVSTVTSSILLLVLLLVSRPWRSVAT